MLNYLFPNCIITGFEVIEKQLILKACSGTKEGKCPSCQESSSKVHGYYQRHPHDLPLVDYGLQLCLKVKRFYCLNNSCDKTTFAESLEPWLARHAQRTRRLSEKQSWVALMLSAKASENLLAKLQIPISHDTALRLVNTVTIPDYETPRVLGVDDFAIRKRKSYGTVLLNLEKRAVIEVLPDRSSATLIKWLEEHPGVEIISRDRSQDYKSACDKGAPDAIQVADRWHLLKNLSDVLKRWFERHKKQLLEPLGDANPDLKKQAMSEYRANRFYERTLLAKVNHRNERIARFEEAKRLKQDGLSLAFIAEKLGMGKSTLYRWFSKYGFPDKQRERMLEPFMPYLKERYEAGISNKMLLYREILSQGFEGSYALVYNYFSELEAGFDPQNKVMTKPKKLNRYTSFEATRLFTMPNKDLNELNQHRLSQLFKGLDDAKACYDLAQRFIALFHRQDEAANETIELFNSWLEDAKLSSISELARFARGLNNDKAAIEAALTLPWSNGQTEGKITKLKLIKRSMYGRASFKLLRQKVLLAA